MNENKINRNYFTENWWLIENISITSDHCKKPHKPMLFCFAYFSISIFEKYFISYTQERERERETENIVIVFNNIFWHEWMAPNVEFKTMNFHRISFAFYDVENLIVNQISLGIFIFIFCNHILFVTFIFFIFFVFFLKWHTVFTWIEYNSYLVCILKNIHLHIVN